MEKKDILTIGLNACSVLVAIASAVTSIAWSRFAWKQQQLQHELQEQRQEDNAEMARAPMLWATAYKINAFEKYQFKDDQKTIPPNRHFSLDRRTFEDPQKQGVSRYSMFCNTVDSDTKEDPTEIIAIGTLRLKNLGYKVATFEMETVEIIMDEKNAEKNFVLKPPTKSDDSSSHNELYMPDNEVEMFVSFLSPTRGDFIMFNLEAAKKAWEDETLDGVDLLNTYVQKAIYCTMWDMIIVTGVTTNTHGEQYRQDIRLIMKDGVMTTSSTLIERVKK